MNRLPRRASGLAAALSAVPCVVVCGLWVRSYAVRDSVERPGDQGGLVACSSERGTIRIGHDRAFAGGLALPVIRERPSGYSRQPAKPAIELSDPPTPALRDWRLPGFRWLVTGGSGPQAYLGSGAGPFPDSTFAPEVWIARWVVSISHAFPALALAALPAYRLRGRTRRTPRGHCPGCGYDLRATPADAGPLLGRCPECGHAPGQLTV